MERTESVVVQVAPDYENEKIKEMEIFGWNLQGRQEIHEEGEAYGRPSYIDSNEYLIKTTVYRYVKLHFKRSLNLPNLEKIKELEEQYYSLSFPKFPHLFPPGGIWGFTLWLFLWFLWPVWYFVGYIPKKAAARTQLADALAKQEEIRNEVKALI